MSIYRLNASVALADTVLLLAQPPMLHSLTLCQCGVRTLPQLRPLTVLSTLCELNVLESPVTKLALLRPFVAALLPRLELLNGETLGDDVKQTGTQCFAPLLQELWGDLRGSEVAPGNVTGRAMEERIEAGGWGLSLMLELGAGQEQATSAAGGVDSGSVDASRKPGKDGTIRACEGTDDEQSCRTFVEDGVDQVVAHALDVERRWYIMEACWDNILSEILDEWSSLLE